MYSSDKCTHIAISNRHLWGDIVKQIPFLAGDVDRLILREKDLSPDEYSKLAKSVIQECDKYHIECVLHSFVDVAISLNFRRIHLPLHILESYPREYLKEHFDLIGSSIHSTEEAIRAEKAGADYFLAGNVFETKCKEGLEGKGLSFLRDIKECVNISVYALGGITDENEKSCLETGIEGTARMSGYVHTKYY